MIPPNPSFWEWLSGPVHSRTPVTPTLTVIKLVTPISLILMLSLRNTGLALPMFYLAAAPVVAAIMQIGYLTIANVSLLTSETHSEEMARISATINQNNLDGSTTPIIRTSSRISNNPMMDSDGSSAPNMIEAPK